MSQPKSFLDFVDGGRSVSGRTRVTRVLNHGGGFLGRISWYAPWRRYCVEMEPGAIFDAACLHEIAEHLTLQTEEQKAIQVGHAKAREARERI